MALTPVQICNRALAYCNAQRIRRLDPREGYEARLCYEAYHPKRREILAEAPWRFAIRQTKLVESGYDPVPSGWALAYVYPSDCLRFVRFVDTFGVKNSDIRTARDFTGDSDTTTVYRRVPGDALQTPDGFGFATYSTKWWENLNRYSLIVDDRPPSEGGGGQVILTNRGDAYGEYVADVEANFDPVFEQYLAYSIAMDLLAPLGASPKVEKRVENGYVIAKGKAGTKNANEENDLVTRRPSWLERR